MLILHVCRTIGLSPDFVFINPLGFLALSLWNWGVYLSPIAKRQYESRHDGHSAQISIADLAFSLHALLVSTAMLVQVIWYARRTKAASTEEEDTRRLLPSLEGARGSGSVDLVTPIETTTPSLPCQLVIGGIIISSVVLAILVWVGRMEWLDWLYFASTIKLIVSVVKYLPQVLLNWRLSSVEGFSIGNVILVSRLRIHPLEATLDTDEMKDLTGSIFSFIQLIVSSIFVEHDPSGIVANPAKLGLAGLTVVFDLVFLVQKYWWFRGRGIADAKEPPAGVRSDEEDED